MAQQSRIIAANLDGNLCPGSRPQMSNQVLKRLVCRLIFTVDCHLSGIAFVLRRDRLTERYPLCTGGVASVHVFRTVPDGRIRSQRERLPIRGRDSFGKWQKTSGIA